MADNTRIELMQAAKQLGMAYHAVLNLVLRGELKGEKVNKHWMVDVRSVEARLRHLTPSRRGQQ